MSKRRAATHFVIAGLRRERAYLAGEIDQAERRLVEMRAKLHNLDTTLVMFAPDDDPAGIRTIMAIERGKYFGYREQTRFILATLRQSPTPLTIRQLTELAMETKGLDVADVTLRVQLTEHVRLTLKRLERRGYLYKIGHSPAGWWMLPLLAQR